MELYSVILYAHIVCAMGMAAGIAILMVGEGAARRASTPGELRTILERDERTASFVKAMALVLVTSGLFMAHTLGRIGAPWVIASLIVFVYLASTGPLVFGRRMRNATAAAASAGAITPAVRQMLNDPVLAMMGRQRVALLALLPFLMTTKPGWGVTLAAFVTALALGALSGVLLPEKSREATEAT
jgi:hypothetical protein